MRKKSSTYYTRKYGKNISVLSYELKVMASTISKWERQGFDIFFKANELNVFRKNKTLKKLWSNLKSRCGNKNDKRFKYYGGKGIKICLTKYDLKYLWIRDKAYNLKQPSLDRIDPKKDYSIENCRFVEMAENRKLAHNS